MLRLRPLLGLLCLPAAVSAFGSFQLPKMPWDQQGGNAVGGNSPFGGAAAQMGGLQPGDTVTVVGASGNVDKLVALRLSDTYKVKGVVRDSTSVESFFGDRMDNGIELYEADLLEEMKLTESGCPDALRPALADANAIVICTGTTAFPTKAWSRNEEKEVTLDVLSALWESKFDVPEAIATLTNAGLNTPQNVDDKANLFLYEAWKDACKVSQKRAILLSSICIQRRDQMPFPILNACGVLDAKASAEAALIDTAAKNGYAYTIVRPGQLFGGPYDNNYYLGTLFQLDKDAATQDVQVGLGDELLGDTLRSTLAEVTAQICEGDCALNVDFAVVNVKGEAPSVEGIQERLGALNKEPAAVAQ